MKIRTGFVSNSSTSSFIVIGARVENVDQVQLAKLLLKKYPNVKLPSYLNDKDISPEDWAFEVLDALQDVCPYVLVDENEIFGYKIYEGSSEDYNLESFELNATEFETRINEVIKLFKELGLPETEVKLIGGTQSC